jgi:hypothetical protein
MEKPWTDGSKELLTHALDHLAGKSDFDRRVAFISIDNAVELIIKTFLGLPKRIKKCSGPNKKELDEAENSFPELLNILEKFNKDKIVGIKLEDIEWYHRIRNQLYHSGNCRGSAYSPTSGSTYSPRGFEVTAVSLGRQAGTFSGQEAASFR